MIKALSTKNSPVPDGFVAKFYEMAKEELALVILTLIHKTERKVTLSNLCYEGSTTMLQKLYKGTTQRKTYRPISLMNIKIPNKVLEN